ncbi:MAG: hypothetical protein IH904_03160 [Proteobacteria bacterium]|nr:hypothetical protein [Pseudomonadota bacterium]
MHADVTNQVRPDVGEPVVVASYVGLMEADLARARLEAEGIYAALIDNNMVLMDPLATYALGGVKVVVGRDDAAEAAAILNQKPERAKDYACPNCDSTAVHAGRRWAFLPMIFLGFPIGPTKPKHRCNDCGHIWRE